MSLKQRVADGEVLLGTFLKTPSPILVEVLATCGLDLLCIDAEHAPFDRTAIDLCVLAARANALPVIVRTSTPSAEHVLNALDCGADGVLLPHIRSVGEAVDAARCGHFGRGGRGYAGSTRAANYGRSTIPEHLRATRERTTIIAQIEDVEAVDAIDAIAAVDGIDALFVGRIDLAIALGATDPDERLVIDAVEHVVAAAKRAGKPIGMFVPRNADVRTWREKGATLFLQGSDHSFMRSGAAVLREEAGVQSA